MIRRKIKTSDTLPNELGRSTPRQVGLTAYGTAALVTIFSLMIGAIVSGVQLYQRATRDDQQSRLFKTEGREARARVVHIGRGERPTVTFSYEVDGHAYTGRGRIRTRDRKWFQPDAIVSVRYLPSRPESVWLQGQGPRQLPFWLVVAVPGGLLLCIVPIALLLRCQAGLLQEGRGALATVTKTRKVSNGESTSWRIEYEWNLSSGAIRTGWHYSGTNPPPIGALIPIIYDRDNPKRHRPYPMSLVKVSR